MRELSSAILRQVGSACLRAYALIWSRFDAAAATPLSNRTVRPEFDATRSPGTMMPTRFSGSAAATVTTSSVGGAMPHCAQRLDGDRQRELLADEPD